MEKYTISNAMPSGQTNPTYGTEYIVKFAENEGTFKLWYKTAPKEGQEQWGTIDGWKFKKAKRDDIPGGNTSQPGAATSASAPTPTKSSWGRNDDAIRAQWAIGQAVQLGMATGELTEDSIELQASTLFSMVDRVKEGKQVPKTVAETFGITEGK